MNEKLDPRMIALSERSAQVLKKLWEGTTTNPLLDTIQYLLTVKENLELHVTSPGLQPDDLQSYQAQIQKIEGLLETGNPLPDMVEYVISGLPTKHGTNEVIEDFKPVEERFRSYLD